jgi:Dynamin family
LNYLLDVNCLPVDVTPVTAVATRIGYGSRGEAELKFASGPAQIVDLSELWDFATEQGNPNNAKQVTQIQVKLPSPRLRDGITFVDTPGLGSLATSGSADTLTYLPQCDLGILVLEPSAGVMAEDCAILHALSRAGSNAVILISKSDLFNERERAKVIAYVTDQIQRQLAISLPIFPVSVVGESATLCNRWLSEYLEPMLQRHQELATGATRRKIAVLRKAIIASLESRLAPARRSVGWRQPRQQILLEEFRQVERLLASCLRESGELSGEIESQREQIFRETGEEIVTGWLKNGKIIPSEILVAKISQILAEPVSGIGRRYWRARDLTIRALEQAEKACPKGVSLELPGALGMPPLDPSGLVKAFGLRRPPWLFGFSAPLAKNRLRQEIRWQLEPDPTVFLRAYAKQLRNWFREAIGNLRASFQVAAAIYRVDLEPQEIEVSQDQPQVAADLEQLKTGAVSHLESDALELSR